VRVRVKVRVKIKLRVRIKVRVRDWIAIKGNVYTIVCQSCPLCDFPGRKNERKHFNIRTPTQIHTLIRTKEMIRQNAIRKEQDKTRHHTCYNSTSFISRRAFIL
jgi:hypothetical protein